MPWWYRVPPLAASTIVYAVAGILLYLNGVSAFASLALGAVAGLAASFVQGSRRPRTTSATGDERLGYQSPPNSSSSASRIRRRLCRPRSAAQSATV